MILDSNDDDSDSKQSDMYSVAGEDADLYLNHYRIPSLASNGSSSQQKSRRNKEQVKCNNEGKIMSLFELAAQKVACHHSFGQVEHFIPTVPEPMQCRIAFWSFPQDEEDIRLYTALANGRHDVYYRAEDLISLNCVCDMLQVGFHLSANVRDRDVQVLTNDMDCCRVAVTFDRRRITSCSCSCPQQTFWCQHVVAVCLQRIRKSHEVTLRAPVSESLHRLEKNQLQKFAQYLINELPQQILPAAQKLLDELLSGEVAIINQNPAAPDPTAGATINEQTSWCLDDSGLSCDIQKMLLKHCTTQPTVCSDIQALHTSAPPAATEYSQLLRPIRGREPGGLWNLIFIVEEMMKRHDSNFFILLEILTQEILKCDKIITWWFETKVSLHSGSTIHCTNTKGNSQSTSQYSSSNLCDEIVHLWKLAAMDPNATAPERQKLYDKFFRWHLRILEKHSNIQEVGANNNPKPGKRNVLEIFPGFKPAMEGCLIDWSDWDIKKCKLIVPTQPTSEQVKSKSSKKKKKKSKSLKQCASEPTPSTSAVESTNDESSKSAVETEQTAGSDRLRNDHDSPESTQNENSEPLGAPPEASRSLDEVQRQPLQPRNMANEANNVNPIEPELQVYFMDRPPEGPPAVQRPESIEDLIKVNLRKLNDPLETLYSKAEGLWAHGHIEEARLLANRVAHEIMTAPDYPSLKQLYTLPRRRKKKGSLDNQMSIVASEALSKIGFLCNVLAETPENYTLVFKLALFGVEMKRSPAATKPLEVKLVNQKHDLISLLKGIPLHDEELLILRDRALALKEENHDASTDALTTLILGNYIFEALVLSKSPSNTSSTNRPSLESSRVPAGGSLAQPGQYQLEEHHIQPGELAQQSTSHACEQMRSLVVYGKVPQDASLGFQAALNALSVRSYISETDHPLLCEGIRRQRGELALSLLTHYKDEQDKLDLILQHLLEKDAILSQSVPETSEKPVKKINPSQDPNLPTEASAYFMFELAKTVFDKAGGNSMQSHLFRPQLISQNGGRGIHRRLHMCMLRIALYALGLQNRTSSNWMQRTYNGRASFIHEEALEIGLPAIKFLSENWEGYLTPVEVALIADKAGCSNDAETKRVAAEMAKSCLKFANYLDFNAVRRILGQCKEQSVEMIEEACGEIELVADSDSVCADVLFATARAWYNLYEKLILDENQAELGRCHQRDWAPAEQDPAVADWLVASNMPSPQDRCLPANETLQPFNWEVYGRVGTTMYTPTYKHTEYLKAAYRVGIKALDALRPSSTMNNKHNPKKEDDILWLLGLSKSLGRDSLHKFSRSAIKNIFNPHVLYIICSDLIKFFENQPQDHVDRVNILLPLIDKCLDKFVKQTKDIVKHYSYDQVSYIESIFDFAQNLTAAANTLTAAAYFRELLKTVDAKRSKRNRSILETQSRHFWLDQLILIMDPLCCTRCQEISSKLRTCNQGI